MLAYFIGVLQLTKGQATLDVDYKEVDVNSRNYHTVYFIKSDRPLLFGASMDNLSMEQRRDLQRNRGVVLRIIHYESSRILR